MHVGSVSKSELEPETLSTAFTPMRHGEMEKCCAIKVPEFTWPEGYSEEKVSPHRREATLTLETKRGGKFLKSRVKAQRLGSVHTVPFW